MDLAHKIIIALLVVLILIHFFDKKQENAGSVSGSQVSSTEAVANIAKVYADSSGTATFNNIRITGNITADSGLNLATMKGIIVAWSGSVDTIPTGWKICDGQTYSALDGTQLKTPDLRGKFILSAGLGKDPSGNNLTERTVNEQGGEEKHKLTIAEIPSHAHGTYAGSTGWGGWHSAGSSDGQATTNPTGGDKAHNNMPPYYVLAYIIKL